MESIQFAKHKLLFNKVVFVDGTAHVGKMMLGPILSTYRGVEMQRLDTVFEQIAVLHHYGKISMDGAVTLMREYLDETLYNLTIGRNINFRSTDLSSVFFGRNQQRYLTRMFGGEGDPIVEEIARTQPVYQNLTHEILGFIEPCFEAFGDAFRVIEVVRHPADLVTCWMKRGWGDGRLHEDPRSFVITFDHHGTQLPYYAFPFRDRYLDMEPTERVIHCIHSCNERIAMTYRALSPERKQRVLFTRFEDLVTKPTAELARLQAFVGVEPGPQLQAVVKEQGIPRVLEVGARDAGVREWLANTPASARLLLDQMIADYEKFDVERP